MMSSYLVGFVFWFWPGVATTVHQQADMRLDAAEVAATDCTPSECLRLMNIAALESGFRRDARGKLGECGAWQILDGPCTAKEALRRMRVQGMLGYIGCRDLESHVVIQGRETTCRDMIAHRVDRADLYRMGIEPPTSRDAEGDEEERAENE
jgi:hypothetical protein